VRRSSTSFRRPVHQLRPSGPPLATQRRVISVVEGQNGENCDHADRASGGLKTNGKICWQHLRRGVPGMTMCGRRRRAGRLMGHIVKPRTSRWRVFLVSCYDFGRGLGPGSDHGSLITDHTDPGIGGSSMARDTTTRLRSSRVVASPWKDTISRTIRSWMAFDEPPNSSVRRRRS